MKLPVGARIEGPAILEQADYGGGDVTVEDDVALAQVPDASPNLR